MRQFDVFRNPSLSSAAYAPLVVVLSSHLVEAMPTVVLAPMLIAIGRRPYSKIAAAVIFNDQNYIVSVGELATIEARRLRRAIGDIREYEDQIRRAIDRLFSGF